MKRNLWRGRKVAIFSAAVLCFLLFFHVGSAFANLMIMPTRHVFKDGQRMRVFTLVNRSNTPASYEISFHHQLQTEDGGLKLITNPADYPNDLSKMLVFSPRRVNLEPNGKQVVRVSVRRPADLPDGEYRTYVKMKSIPYLDAKRGPVKGQVATASINVGFAVPLMLRKGTYDTTAKITAPQLLPGDGKKARPRLRVVIERSGKYSALGVGKVYLKTSSGERQIGLLNGLNVYSEVDKRRADIPLEEEVAKGSVLRVVFEGLDADKGVKFDEISFPVQ